MPVKITARLLLASLALAAVCPTLRAQDSAPAPGPSAAPSPAMAITPGQKDKLKAAYVVAVQDPKVVAALGVVKDAWDNFRGIVKKKILANDPGMQPLFDKADKASAVQAAGGAATPLGADDQKAMHDAFQKVESDPDIKAAMAKLDEAKKAKNVLIRAAILKADPSLGPVLDEIDKATAPAASPGVK